MTVAITSPTDGQTSTPNPITAQGTAATADGDYLQGRWERSDGKVWNGQRWIDVLRHGSRRAAHQPGW